MGQVKGFKRFEEKMEGKGWNGYSEKKEANLPAKYSWGLLGATEDFCVMITEWEWTSLPCFCLGKHSVFHH